MALHIAVHGMCRSCSTSTQIYDVNLLPMKLFFSVKSGNASNRCNRQMVAGLLWLLAEITVSVNVFTVILSSEM